jgi:hypothetical protein
MLWHRLPIALRFGGNDRNPCGRGMPGGQCIRRDNPNLIEGG